jgi:hypothetical protein
MSEKKMDEGPEGDKSDLDLVEEALVGTHQEVPRDAGEDGGEPVGSHDGKPPVPGHRSP